MAEWGKFPALANRAPTLEDRADGDVFAETIFETGKAGASVVVREGMTCYLEVGHRRIVVGYS